MTSPAVPFALQRLGTIMEPDPARPEEAWGVLNPAACRDRSGDLLLFARARRSRQLFAHWSGARALEGEEPAGVERLGYALEPSEGFERNEHTAGVEDPRITFIPALDRYVMAYAAYGPLGPRVALAISPDARHWERLGWRNSL